MMITLLRNNFEYAGYNIIHYMNLSNDESEMVRCWRNDIRIRYWMTNDHLISREEHACFMERLKGNVDVFHWVVRKNMDYLGNINLTKFDKNSNCAYLGIYKNPDIAVPGVGHELMRCLKHLAFDVKRLKQLKLEVMDFNHHARAFYEMEGFKEIGIIKQHIGKKDRRHDSFIMSLGV